MVAGITTRIVYKKGLERAFFWLFWLIVNIDNDSSLKPIFKILFYKQYL